MCNNISVTVRPPSTQTSAETAFIWKKNPPVRAIGHLGLPKSMLEQFPRGGGAGLDGLLVNSCFQKSAPNVNSVPGAQPLALALGSWTELST